eukprot:GFYU01023949.1.p1 GENE.GFYU01023949.1~~GFYU01023949.1.p1  ORF type:complete len:112 (+),score=17.24 GFYU01023949.1:30-338(+)
MDKARNKVKNQFAIPPGYSLRSNGKGQYIFMYNVFHIICTIFFWDNVGWWMNAISLPKAFAGLISGFRFNRASLLAVSFENVASNESCVCMIVMCIVMCLVL